MPKETEVPAAVPAVAVSVDELRAEVREKQIRVWKSNHVADLLIDFSKSLEVTLFEEKILTKLSRRSRFGFTSSSEQEVLVWSVKVRNGDRERKICYMAKGSAADAVTLVNMIEAAKAEYERAVRALKQAEDSVTL